MHDRRVQVPYARWYRTQLVLRRGEHEIQLAQAHREMIEALRQQPLAILARRKGNIVLGNQLCSQSAELHSSDWCTSAKP